MITLALKNPQQPRSRLAPLIVEAAAVVLKPFRKLWVMECQAVEELAPPQSECSLQCLAIVAPAKVVKFQNIGHHGPPEE